MIMLLGQDALAAAEVTVMQLLFYLAKIERVVTIYICNRCSEPLS